MEGVVREDLIDLGCTYDTGEILRRPNVEMEVAMTCGLVCCSADHLFRRINSVPRAYRRSKGDKLSARTAAYVKHHVGRLRIEHLQNLLHTLTATGISIGHVASGSTVESFCMFFGLHLSNTTRRVWLKRGSADSQQSVVRNLSFLPVVGVAVQVHDRHDNDFLLSLPEKYAKRKRFREASTDIKINDRVEAWIDTDAVDGVLNGSQEPTTKIRLLCFVVGRRLDHLGFCIGIKPGGLHVSAA